MSGYLHLPVVFEGRKFDREDMFYTHTPNGGTRLIRVVAPKIAPGLVRVEFWSKSRGRWVTSSRSLHSSHIGPRYFGVPEDADVRS